MTERSTGCTTQRPTVVARRARRRHAAAGSRMLVAGASTAGLITLVGAMADAGPVASTTGLASGAVDQVILAPVADPPAVPMPTDLPTLVQGPERLVAARVQPVGHTRGS